jgi:putative SOS response-associated peptidase YedK
MKWGLIPNWARDASIANGTINAKSETAAEKPALRDPFKYRRCLIPADGFYYSMSIKTLGGETHS